MNSNPILLRRNKFINNDNELVNIKKEVEPLEDEVDNIYNFNYNSDNIDNEEYEKNMVLNYNPNRNKYYSNSSLIEMDNVENREKQHKASFNESGSRVSTGGLRENNIANINTNKSYKSQIQKQPISMENLFLYEKDEKDEKDEKQQYDIPIKPLLPPTQEKPKPPQNFFNMCSLCNNSISSSKIEVFCCRCNFCYSCLQTYVKTQNKQVKNRIIRCPNKYCIKNLEINFINTILDDKPPNSSPQQDI